MTITIINAACDSSRSVMEAELLQIKCTPTSKVQE